MTLMGQIGSFFSDFSYFYLGEFSFFNDLMTQAVSIVSVHQHSASEALKPGKARAECVIGVGGECSWAHSKVIFLLQLPRILEVRRLLREDSPEWVTDPFLTTAGMLETPECLPCPTCPRLIQLLVDKDTFCFRAPSIYFYSLCLRFCSGGCSSTLCLLYSKLD